MRLVIRPATTDDATAIATVHVKSWREAYRGLMPQAMLDGLSIEQRAGRWTTIISDTGGVIVAERDERIVGFASVGGCADEDAAADTGELYALYVDPGHWSTGAGHALHDSALGGLVTIGFAQASLWVLDRNERAIGFYRGHGWAPDGATKDDPRDGFVLHELRFVRPLSG